MFSFLKKQSASPPSTSDASAGQRDDQPRDQAGTPEPPTSAAADHPLAAMVWDSPDVPRDDDDTAGSGTGTDSYGLDVGALVEPPAATPGSGFGPNDQARTDALKPLIVEALSTIYDPEIPVDIYELGLIYDIVSDAEGRVTVTMTLTSPACPSAQQLPMEAQYKAKAVEGVTDVYVDVVWEPPWTKDMMSETAKLGLGMF